MFLYVHSPTKRVVYVLPQGTAALQSLEGTLLKRVYLEPQHKLTLSNCLQYTYGEVLEHHPLVLQAEDPLVLLQRKCVLLYAVGRMLDRVRYPYSKTFFGQEYIYDRKYEQASRFVNATPEEREELVKSNELFYLGDEAEVNKTDRLTVALEIRRMRLEREDVFRYSERARRQLTLAIGTATSLDRLKQLEGLITERNFKLPFEVPNG